VTDSECPSAAGGDIGEATVLQVLRVADLLTRIGDSKVFGKELTQAQFNVLMVLKRHGAGGLSQKDILENLVSTKGNVSIHISNLSRMGYIRKKTSQVDSRMNVITLTAKGKRVLDDLEPRYVQHLKEITGDLPNKDAEAAMAVLTYLQERCNATLNASDDPREGGNES
jgi:DNA-binding MarR family transcriptional regulator